MDKSVCMEGPLCMRARYIDRCCVCVCVFVCTSICAAFPASHFQTDLARSWQIDAASQLAPGPMNRGVARWNLTICHSTPPLIHFVVGHRAQCRVNWLDWWEETRRRESNFFPSVRLFNVAWLSRFVKQGRVLTKLVCTHDMYRCVSDISLIDMCLSLSQRLPFNSASPRLPPLWIFSRFGIRWHKGVTHNPVRKLLF